MDDWAALQKKRHTEAFKRHGVTPPGVCWGADADKNNARHGLFMRLVDIGSSEPLSLLDIGCGYGDFYARLKQANVPVVYHGIDVVTESLEYARKTYPEATFFHESFLDWQTDRRFDVCIASGIFNIKGRLSLKEIDIRAKNIVRKMFNMCNRCIGFDMISTHVNYYADDMFYKNPIEMAAWCMEELSTAITMDHATAHYEYTMFVYNLKDKTP